MRRMSTRGREDRESKILTCFNTEPALQRAQTAQVKGLTHCRINSRGVKTDQSVTGGRQSCEIEVLTIFLRCDLEVSMILLCLAYRVSLSFAGTDI